MTESRIFELAELNLGYDGHIRPVEFARAIEREVNAEQVAKFRAHLEATSPLEE